MKQALIAAASATMLIAAGCQNNDPLGDMDRPVIDPQIAEQPATQAIIAEPSQNDYQTTISKLETALASRPLTVFATVDHAAGAREAGLTLAPSTLFIFGNPKSGTPIMQENPALGLELPMKILVVETENGVQVLRQNLSATLEQYDVDPASVNAGKIEETLATIVSEAAD